MRGERAACIVVEVRVALVHQRLELRHDGVIAARTGYRLAELVVDLTAAVERQHAVVHVLIDILALVLIEQQTVGGDGEAELLVILLLQAAGIIDRLGNGIPRHERLATEEIDLDVVTHAGTRDNKVDGLLGDLGRHDLAALTKVAGGCKAVLAAQVAVVRYMQAQSLDRCIHRNVAAYVDVVILREQLTGLFQLVQLVICLADLVRGVVRQGVDDALRTGITHVFIQQSGHCIADIIEQMYRARVDIEHEIQPFFLITMNHLFSSDIQEQGAPAGAPCIFLLSVITLRARTSGLPRCKRSCMRTGRKSGTRRSRRVLQSASGLQKSG